MSKKDEKLTFYRLFVTQKLFTLAKKSDIIFSMMFYYSYVVTWWTSNFVYFRRSNMVHLSIEERLVILAESGRVNGFTLKLWKSQVSRLQKQGIVVTNPRPTDRKGENRYDIDFSLPLPGTMSEKLYGIAVEANPKLKEVSEIPPEPLNHPYEMD